MKTILVIAAIMILSCIAYAESPIGKGLYDSKGNLLGGGPYIIPTTIRNDSVTGVNPFKNISTTRSDGLSYKFVRITCTDSTGNYVACAAQTDDASGYSSFPSGEGYALPSKDSTLVKIGLFGVHATGSSTTIVVHTGRM